MTEPFKIIINQSCAILIDGNNIEMSLQSLVGNPSALVDFDKLIPKLLQNRGLSRLIYFREGVHISDKLADRLLNQFHGSVIPCHKSADIPLTIKATQIAQKVDTIIIMSGDSDYVELVRHLRGEGVRVEIAAIRQTTARILIEEADHFTPITEEDCYILKSYNSQNSQKTPTKPSPRSTPKPASKSTERVTSKPSPRSTPKSASKLTERATSKPSARPTSKPASKPTERPTSKPASRSTSKSTPKTASKAVAKSTSEQKKTEKKPAPKNTSAKESNERRASTQNNNARKAPVRKAPTRKSPVKKAEVKKEPTKTSARNNRNSATKESPQKKAPAKKVTPRKTPEKKGTPKNTSEKTDNRRRRPAPKRGGNQVSSLKVPKQKS